MLGTYLGAIGGIQTNSLLDGARARSPPARRSTARTSPSQTGGKAFSLSFPPALTIEQASTRWRAYTA